MSSRLGDPLLAAGVLLIAAGLRFYHLGWGLPEHFFPDEATVFHLAKEIAASGELHTGFVSYPPLTMYMLAAVYKALALTRGQPVELLTIVDLVWWGRVVMAVCSLATVAAVAALGRAVYSPAVGLLAALYLAVAPAHITQSHIVCTDVPLTLIVVLTLVVSAGGALASGWWCALLGGVFAGLAAGAKYPGGIVTLAPASNGLRGLFSAMRSGDGRRTARWILLLALTGAAALAAFTLAFPHWIQDLALLRRRFAWEKFANRDMGNITARLAPEGLRGMPVLYQLLILFPWTLGLPLYLLALVGLVRMAWRPSAGEMTLLAFAVPYFAFFATARSVFTRYYLPLVPVLTLAAARVAVSCGRPGTWARAAVVAVAVAAAGHSFALSLSLTAHTSVRPQHALRAALERALAEGRFETPPTLARRHPPFEGYLDYTGLRWVLRGLPLQDVPVRFDLDWLRSHRPDFVLVSEMDEIIAFRNFPVSEDATTLRKLAAGRLPYQLIDEVRVSYLHRDLYGWLDPYFRIAYERGEMGFRLYGFAMGHRFTHDGRRGGRPGEPARATAARSS